MAFQQAAKSLLAQTLTAPVHRPHNDTAVKLDKINQLFHEAGFSPKDVLRDLRELADDCGEDDKNVKLQISKLMLQALGMLSNDEVAAKSAPTFQIVIQGDGNRINTMLCPLA